MSESFLHGIEFASVDDGLRPIQIRRSSVIGVVGTAPQADEQAFPLNTPVLIAGSRRKAQLLGRQGTLPAALDGIFDQCGAVVVVVRIAPGNSELATLQNAVGGVDEQGRYTGVYALLAAASTVQVTPRILCAPGLTHQRPADPDDPSRRLANPVVAELLPIAERLRAIVVADGPSTTDEEAIAWRGDFDSARLMVVDPWVRVVDPSRTDVPIRSEPASARVAGLIARVDDELGFWASPSNHVLHGIVGLARPIDYAQGDVNCRANLLNEAHVTTIVHDQGYRLWGNRSCTDDAKWMFVSVKRTEDAIAQAIVHALRWAQDRNITRTFVEDVLAMIDSFLRELKRKGALIGARCWADEELNTPAALAQGRVYFDFEFTPSYPAERITVRSHLVTDYLSEVFK